MSKIFKPKIFDILKYSDSREQALKKISYELKSFSFSKSFHDNFIALAATGLFLYAINSFKISKDTNVHSSSLGVLADTYLNYFPDYFKVSKFFKIIDMVAPPIAFGSVFLAKEIYNDFEVNYQLPIVKNCLESISDNSDLVSMCGDNGLFYVE